MAKRKHHKKSPFKRGRPRVSIDLEQVEKLGALQCTIAEASAFLGIPEGTLKTRPDFSTAFKKGHEVGKASLRRTQFKLAQKSAAMAIWLGKQYLGQQEKFEIGYQELMEEELEILPKNDKDIKNRIAKYLN